MQLSDVFEWLESSQVATYIRQSPLLYPVIEIIHIIGIIFLTGSAFLFDLRLLGVSKNVSIKDLADHLLPWSRRSLLLVLPSGLLLFLTQAESLSTNKVFGIKLVLISIAFLNAGLFHFFTSRKISGNTKKVPLAAKAAAIISLLLWAGVIACGRLIAYY